MIKSRMQFPVLKKFTFQSGRRRLQMESRYDRMCKDGIQSMYQNMYQPNNAPIKQFYTSNLHSYSKQPLPSYNYPPPGYSNANSNLGLNYNTLKGNLRDATVSKDEFIDGSIGGETFTQSIGGETYQTQSVGGETYNSLSQSNFRDMIFSWHKAPRHPQHDLINKIDPSIKGFENGSNGLSYDKSVASLGTNFPVPLGIFLNSQD